MSSTILLKICL